ncbi:DUF4410 domain-containing protein [Dechloromonas sp. XY25]|uniref:DUF4410 domain-containing protein n=1 Tax=Dechloromonas hankyongensis TaxID=2908002 RepID=A0ABS9JWT5_9RHOO|nr:DUF4410 domain-containing protein [Dechloromonas hankyongensis]MCG2575383.1 DUF4410 domain-containing protein [Dechloromonas hankyongensis]
MKIGLVLLVAASVVLTGCASGVTRAPSSPTAQAVRPVNPVVSAVSTSFTDDGKAAASENLKFNADELRSHVKRALEANSLLNGKTDSAAPELEIRIKGVRVRSNFSAVMWGIMAGSDYITADVVLKDAAGKEIDKYEVSVSYGLGGLAGGQDTTRMGWLYEKFAEETVKELKRP